MFHVGHLNLLIRARALCDVLVVGVVTDQALFDAKSKWPVVPLEERKEIVGSMTIVDRVVTDRSSDKRLAWQTVGFDVLFKGDDWKDTPKGDQLEAQMAEVGAEVHYFPYTADTSSTALRALITQRMI